MGVGEDLADADAQGPNILRAQSVEVDQARVLAAGEPGPLAMALQPQGLERVALPLRPGDVATEDQLRRAGGLVDPLVEGGAEVSQGPVILEVGRLVQEPGGRPARPAAFLETILAVEEELKERVFPFP